MKRAPTRLAGAAVAALCLCLSAKAAEPYRYDWLTPTNLPGPSVLVESALKALPRTVREKQDWLERMHRAAWLPTVELRYDVGEGVIREYTVGTHKEFTTDNGLHRDSRIATRSPYEHVTVSGPESYATGEHLRDMDTLGVAVSWDLSRLIFREEEIKVSDNEIEKVNFRQGAKSQVIDTYYALVETLLLLDSATYHESVPTRVKRERLAYLLDSLTDGALSASAGRKAP